MSTAKQPLVGTPRITITKDMVLREIMYHEFPLHRTVNGQDSLGLDEKPLAAFVQGLTDPQLEFLLTYKPPAGHNDRLVAFITKTNGQGKLMGADWCNPPANSRMRSNASFAVFHCKRDADPVLVCFTEELWTWKVGALPDWYLNRQVKVDTSKVLKICAVIPVYDEAWNVWHRVVTKDGVDLMPGASNLMNNSIHGEINTQGCWILFRNFNWPKSNYEEFERAYRELYRNDKDTEYQDRLVALGYSVNGVYDAANREKATEWDRNFAYTQFTRHVVGVKYFSRTRYNSLYNTDGEHFHAAATQAYLDAVVPGVNAHNVRRALTSSVAGFLRKSSDPRLVLAPDDLFDDSRLKFKRQQRWAPTLTQDKVTVPLERSWAELVLFK